MAVTTEPTTEPGAESPGHLDGCQLDGRQRVAIENVTPRIDAGTVPIKRIVGESIVVEADLLVDGHPHLAGEAAVRPVGQDDWDAVRLTPIGNDRWRGTLLLPAVGRYQYVVHGWIDHFGTWRRDLAKKFAAGQDVAVELLVGATLVEEAAARAPAADASRLAEWARSLRDGPLPARVDLALDGSLAKVMDRYPDRSLATTSEPILEVVVDRERARVGAWYELFPRSCAPTTDRPGTLRDCAARLPYVASMGFDVLYLPPIHPIGSTHRKGRNNAPEATPDDPGSPWAIGAAEGGHDAIHPALGNLADFQALVARARDHGLEIALDLAFQCSPDHPYVREHPEWFVRRPDGSIQFAENPPKQYQDIYPFDFECAEWRTLWQELKRVVLFWVDQGVQIFRVDNPHTKPFRFWEWLITEVKETHPTVLFLAEAFTRPKIMEQLARVGFSQSYTYFAWRNTKAEIIDYFTTLTQTPLREYFRPNLWPNTPDILTEYLQYGGRSAFMARLVLAATLGASYGIYGPAFELGEHEAVAPGREEYLNSEKYEQRHWDLDRTDSLRDFIARVNRIRRENPALHADWSLRFHPVDNEQLLAYSKSTPDGSDTILVVVNLDPYHTQAGWGEWSLEALGLDPQHPYQAHDLLGGSRYLWQGTRSYVELDPRVVPAHIFRLRRRVRTERDFEYYL
jgi:starch synthase (maltosyl-transferring)